MKTVKRNLKGWRASREVSGGATMGVDMPNSLKRPSEKRINIFLVISWRCSLWSTIFETNEPHGEGKEQ